MNKTQQSILSVVENYVEGTWIPSSTPEEEVFFFFEGNELIVSKHYLRDIAEAMDLSDEIYKSLKIKSKRDREDRGYPFVAYRFTFPE